MAAAWKPRVHVVYERYGGVATLPTAAAACPIQQNGSTNRHNQEFLLLAAGGLRDDQGQVTQAGQQAKSQN